MLVRFAEGQVDRAELAEAARTFEEICDVDDDAVTAALYSFRTLNADGAESAGWAAETAYNARDRVVVERLQVKSPAAEDEAIILAHPLIQEELIRQREDMASLAAEPGVGVAVVTRAQVHGSGLAS